MTPSTHTGGAGTGGRTRRRFLAGGAAVLAGSLGAVGAACSPAGSTGTTGSNAPQAGGLSGKVRFFVRADAVEQMGQTEVLLPSFQKVAPNVEVVHDVFAASTPDETYSAKLLTLWAAGTPPDVWGFGQNYMLYWAKGMVTDITPLINRDKVDLTQFHPGLPDRFRVHGKYYGLPQLTTFGTLLFYNKALFQSAGIPFPTVDWDDKAWTFDAMFDAARRLTKNPGDPDATYGINFGPQVPNMAAWFFGGDAFLPEHWTDGMAPRTQLDSHESLDGHQYLQDLRWKYHVAPQPGKDPTDGIDFTKGRYAMAIAGGWNFWSYTTIKDFAWAAAALPSKVTNKNTNYNDFWELSSQSTNRDAAWALIKSNTNPEVQREYSRVTGTPPTTRAAIDVWYQRYDGLMTRAELEKVTQGAIAAKRSQESPDHLFIEWGKLSKYYTDNVNTPLLANKGTAKEVIAQAKPGYDAVCKEIYDTYKGKTPN
jgi:multiple sugar transport system substrate-binding protein